MDLYGMTGTAGTAGDGFPFSQLSAGFNMALAANETARMRYQGLTESEKEDIILKCKDASTREEAQKILDELLPDGDVALLDERKDGDG